MVLSLRARGDARLMSVLRRANPDARTVFPHHNEGPMAASPGLLHSASRCREVRERDSIVLKRRHSPRSHQYTRCNVRFYVHSGRVNGAYGAQP